MKRRHFKITAKERSTGHIVTPEFIGNKTRKQVIEFFGLREPDIEWYKIEEVPCNMDKDRFNAACDAYRAMYFSAKNDEERRDKINAFRSGIITSPKGNSKSCQTTTKTSNNGTMD